MENGIIASDAIIKRQAELAELVRSMQYSENSELKLETDKRVEDKLPEDAEYLLTYLAESIRAESRDLFNVCIDWVRIVMEARGLPADKLVENLEHIEKACTQLLANENIKGIQEYLASGVETLRVAKTHPTSHLRDDNPLIKEARQYLSLLLKGKRKEAHALIDELVEKKYPIPSIYENIFKATQYEIGLLWQTNKISVAHEHYCTAATQLIMSSLYKFVFKTKRKGCKLLACSVSGELHELGIRMMSDLFELDGWDTYYLGSNMPVVDIISALIEQKADVLAISVTVPVHLTKAENLIKSIHSSGKFDNLKIIVGGYTFNNVPGLWKKIGADGFAENAESAVMLANNLIEKR